MKHMKHGANHASYVGSRVDIEPLDGSYCCHLKPDLIASLI